MYHSVMDLRAKQTRLRELLRGYGEVLVAYSGGIDSALVLKLAHDELGRRAVGVTAYSPSVSRRELQEALRFARGIGAAHRVVRTDEIDDPSYAANPSNRCYFCKSTLYRALAEVARRHGIRHIANGTNLDDLGDHRPGLEAAEEFHVVSPLRDVGLSKAEVRALARRLGLEIWDKPASPCLASRIPYGSPVTREKLANIEEAEEYLRGFGLRDLRVRHFGARARVEVPPGDLTVLNGRMDAIRERLRGIGFEEVELAELRSGALNDLLRIGDPHGPS